MAYSAGFHPHPKISYVNAAPTGVSSLAEYVEIGLARRCDPEQLRAAIDAVLPAGLDILRAVDVADCPPGSLAEQIQGSCWQLELAADPAEVQDAVRQLLAVTEAPVERLTKDGVRLLDARAPLVSAQVSQAGDEPGRAILRLVVRQVTPTVRPDDVLAALRSVAGFAPLEPVRATRLAQGPVDDAGAVGDPLGRNELATAE
jgi:radical SAM-linked protein